MFTIEKIDKIVITSRKRMYDQNIRMTDIFKSSTKLAIKRIKCFCIFRTSSSTAAVATTVVANTTNTSYSSIRSSTITATTDA
jgi:hypothetical protein